MVLIFSDVSWNQILVILVLVVLELGACPTNLETPSVDVSKAWFPNLTPSLVVVQNVKGIQTVRQDTSVKTKNVLRPLTHVIPTLVVLELSAPLKASLALLASVLLVPLEIPKYLAPKENVKEMKIVLTLKLVKITIVSILAKLELVKRITSVRSSDTCLPVVENLLLPNKR